MRPAEQILEVIRASRPTFKNDHDKLVFAVHAAFIKCGFILTATGPSSQTNFCSPCCDEVSIDGWNSNGECYSFVYSLPKWGKLLVKCLPMRNDLMVNILVTNGSQPIHFDISTHGYVLETQKSEYSEHFMHLDKLGKKFDQAILSKLPWEVLRPFHEKKLNLTFIGLRNAGKTTLLKVVDTGDYVEDVRPTEWSNFEIAYKGNVILMVWDETGEQTWSNDWGRACQEARAIVYVVDAADPDNMGKSRCELRKLLRRIPLYHWPLLVVGNKIDKPGALSEQAFTDQMDLNLITDREVSCLMISCKNQKNVDLVIDWFLNHAEDMGEDDFL